jgi:hypothetical protein
MPPRQALWAGAVPDGGKRSLHQSNARLGRFPWLRRLVVRTGFNAISDPSPKSAGATAMDADEKELPITPSDGSDWSPTVAELLDDWRQRVYAAQSAHYFAAGRFRLLNYLVGVPAIVFSSIVGTAIFAGLQHDDKQQTMLIAGISIVAAVLAGLQTFLRFPERASQHATAADWYSAIRRDIEEILHLPAGSRGNAKECLDRIRKEMNRVTQDAPELDVRLWKREARRFGVKEPYERP